MSPSNPANNHNREFLQTTNADVYASLTHLWLSFTVVMSTVYAGIGLIWLMAQHWYMSYMSYVVLRVYYWHNMHHINVKDRSKMRLRLRVLQKLPNTTSITWHVWMISHKFSRGFHVISIGESRRIHVVLTHCVWWVCLRCRTNYYVMVLSGAHNKQARPLTIVGLLWS